MPILIGVSCCLNSSEFKSMIGTKFLFNEQINDQLSSSSLSVVVLMSGQKSVSVGIKKKDSEAQSAVFESCSVGLLHLNMVQYSIFSGYLHTDAVSSSL